MNYTSRSAPLIPSQSWYLSGFGAWSWKHRPGDWKRGCFLLNRRERELEILFIKKTAHTGDGGRERELNISVFSRVLTKCLCPYIEEEPSIGIGQRPDSVTPPSSSSLLRIALKRKRKKGLRFIFTTGFFFSFFFLYIKRGHVAGWCMCLEWDTLQVLTLFFYLLFPCISRLGIKICAAPFALSSLAISVFAISRRRRRCRCMLLSPSSSVFARTRFRSQLAYFSATFLPKAPVMEV